MNKVVNIDGTQGEGGGQVLRTSLTLSAVTGQPIHLVNIRGGRGKPGLLRQHLTCVLALQEICEAEVEGAVLGSQKLTFRPGTPKAGRYHFKIGSAGSTVLVCQTILPVLAKLDSESVVTFEGGTHNGMSPSLCFFQRSFLSVLHGMGLNAELTVERLGFYPAGGGKWQLVIHPLEKVKPISLSKFGGPEVTNLSESCHAKAIMCHLSDTIGFREINAAKKALKLTNLNGHVERVEANGTGNTFQLVVKQNSHESMIELTGEVGVTAENIGKRAAGKLRQFMHSNAAVEEHLADQLMLWLALSGEGEFTTTKLSLHASTNVNVINHILGDILQVEQVSANMYRVNAGELKKKVY